MVQTANKKKRIGLLGGTFDPVHNGHLAVASHVQQSLDLDSVWFIPAALPPHKSSHADGQSITSFAHRFSMLERAIAQNSSFVVSGIEANRSSPSYSIDTINILIQKIGEQVDFFFIIGVDAFLEIDTWKKYQELPSLVNFVVISRPTYPPDKVGEVIRQNFPGFAYDPSCKTWNSSKSKGYFILQHMRPVDISSTDIRKRVRNGKNIRDLIPVTVEEYIKKECLYVK